MFPSPPPSPRERADHLFAKGNPGRIPTRLPRDAYGQVTIDPDHPPRYGVPVGGRSAHDLLQEGGLKLVDDDLCLRVLKAVSDAWGMTHHSTRGMDYILNQICLNLRTQNNIVYGESTLKDLKCVVCQLNPTWGPATQQAANMPAGQVPHHPHEAKVTEGHYRASLYVDLLRVIVDTKTGKAVRTVPPKLYRHVELGQLPCMVDSAICWRRLDPLVDGARAADPGGYFDVGKSRIVVPMDQVRENRPHVWAGSSTKDNIRAVLEFRAIACGSLRSTSTSWIRMFSNHLIAVIIPFTGLIEIPVFGMFRMLGVDTVEQAARMIASGGMLRGTEPIPPDHPWAKTADMGVIRWLLEIERGQTKFKFKCARRNKRLGINENVIPNFEEMDRDDVLDWFFVRSDEEKRNNPRAHRVYTMNDLIISEFFPNINRTSRSKRALMCKAQYLAYQIWLLLQVVQGRSAPDHRDDFAGKQVHTQAFRLAYRASQEMTEKRRMIQKKIGNWLDEGTEPNIPEIYAHYQITRGIMNAMTSGNFARTPTAQTGRDATQLVNWHNPIVAARDFGMIRKDTPKSNKTTRPRNLDPSQDGVSCPLNTPDSDTTGLVHSRPWATTLAAGVPTEALHRAIRRWSKEKREGRILPPGGAGVLVDGTLSDEHPDDPGWDDDAEHDRRILQACREAADDLEEEAKRLNLPRPNDEDKASALCWVFCNGSLAGIAKRPRALAEELREARKKGLVPRETSIYYASSRRAVDLQGEHGGYRRLIMCTGSMGFKRCWAEAKSILDDDRIEPNAKVDAMLNAGVMELICPLEERNCNVRKQAWLTPYETKLYLPPPYSHCEIHPLASMSDIISAIGMVNMAQGVRGTFTTNIYRSAITLLIEWFTRGSAMGLTGAQRSAMTTFGEVEMGLTRHGTGCNVVHAILGLKGNQEDSLEVNQNLVDFGFFSKIVLTTYRQKAFAAVGTNGQGGERFGIPPDDALGKKIADTSALEEDGLPVPGREITRDHVVIGCIGTAQNEQAAANKRTFLQDMSVIPKQAGMGRSRVVRVTKSRLDSHTTEATVTTAEYRCLQPGHKMSSGYGQKGVVANIRPIWDCHCLPDGTVPGIYMGCHGVTSRKTINQNYSTLAGLIAAMVGRPVDGTAFSSGSGWKNLRDFADKHGIQSSNAVMMDPRTGRLMKEKVFVGVEHMKSLKQMTEDKAAYRRAGQPNPTTMQPFRGRKRNGGNRIGEMENNAFMAHGAEYSLRQERFFMNSDGMRYVVCKQCGRIADPNSSTAMRETGSRREAFCRNCQTSDFLANVEIPYFLLKFIRMMEAAMVSIRLKVDDNPEIDASGTPASFIAGKKPIRLSDSRVGGKVLESVLKEGIVLPPPSSIDGCDRSRTRRSNGSNRMPKKRRVELQAAPAVEAAAFRQDEIAPAHAQPEDAMDVADTEMNDILERRAYHPDDAGHRAMLDSSDEDEDEEFLPPESPPPDIFA